MALYLFFRILVRATLRIFYKEFFVLGREKIPTKGPLIMVANHPNTLMDPLIVASLLKQRAGFLGNGSLFRNKWLAALLTYFHVIPIYRKQDILPGEVQDNQDSFRDSRIYLGKGGTLLIFPEGTSFSEKKLRELRTGAARIALSFESDMDFEGGLQLVPVSLNYSDPTRFRSRIRIEVADPIPVSQFKQQYLDEPAEAVRALTDAVKDGIAERLVIVEDKEQELVLNQISKLYLDRIAGTKPQTTGLTALEAELGIAAHIRRIRSQLPTKFQELQLQINKWFEQLDALGLSDGLFRQRFSNRPFWGLWLIQFVSLLVSLPLFIFGLITNYLPYWFCGWIPPKMSDEIEYHAPIMMVIGMFLFPIWYAILSIAFCLIAPISIWWTLALGLLLPISGAFGLYYATVFQRWRSVGKMIRISKLNPRLLSRMREQRTKLMAELEVAREA